MDYRNNNVGASGIAQRQGGGNGGVGGGLNSAFFNNNNNLGNYNNGGGNNSNLGNFRERMAMSNTNSNFNSHSNFNEDRNRDSIMNRNRSPPTFTNRNSNFNSQFNNNSNGNFGNRNPEGFMARNRSPSPNRYNSGMVSNDNSNRSFDRERGFPDNYRNTGNFGQHQQAPMQGEQLGQQENFSRPNNMNVNQNQVQRRLLMDADDIFAAKRRYLEGNMDLGTKNWNNGGNGNDNGGNNGNHPSQSFSSQINYVNRIYSDNPNFNLQNLEGNFPGRGGRNVNINSRQGEMIFNQSGSPGNMIRNSDNDGFRGNMGYRENDGNFGRNNGNMEQSNGPRDRNSSGIWLQPSMGNSNIQRTNVNSNQNSGFQSSSSDSWRASQRDFNANRNLASKINSNQNANRPVYNKPTAASNNRNNQQTANARATPGGGGGGGVVGGGGGGRGGVSNQINNRQQKPQAPPMGNRIAVAKPQNVPQSGKAVQGNKVPASARPTARPGVAGPPARLGVTGPSARPGVAGLPIRPAGARPAVRPVVGRPGIRPAARVGPVRGSVVRGRIARPVVPRPGAANRPTKVQQQAVRVATANVPKVVGNPATTNSTTVNTPVSKAEKRQRKMARKRGFLIGGLKLPYINNKRERLPQVEAESYALAFFEEKPIYTINVKTEEDEVAADIVLDDVFQSEQKDDKTGNSEKPSRMMGKRARKQLRIEWSTLHDSKDYKSWKNWWTDYKRYGAEIHQELVKLGCLNLEHCFLPYLPNSVNLTTEQVVHGVIKSAQFALGDLPGMPYDGLKSIVTLMNVTFLENLKSEADLEVLQDTIRNVPNDLWLFKMRSMVHLWVKYKDIVNAATDKEANVVKNINDKQDAIKSTNDKQANIVKEPNDKEAEAVKPTNDKEAPAVKPTDDKEAPAVKPSDDKEAPAVKPTNDTQTEVVKKTNVKEAAPVKSTNDKEAAITDEGNTSFQWMAKQAFKNPCFHWLSMLAFNELQTISEFAWPVHEKVFPTI